MAISTFKELILVCEALGFEKYNGKNCIIYKGMANGKYCRIVIHPHAQGRDIATGLFHRYVKDLGFSNENDYFDFLRKTK